MDNQASRGLHHFKNYVGIKFQLYNSLFTSLPFHRIEKTGILLSLFVNICEEGFKKKLSPVEIVEEFFARHTSFTSQPEKLDLLFRFTQFVERQVVLFDALEDAAFLHVNDTGGAGTLKQLELEVIQNNKLNELSKKLEDFSIELVLTAHPTQFYPGSVLGIINDLSKSLSENNAAQINMYLQQLGKTPFFKKEKPTPYDEALSLIWYLENVFFAAAGRILTFLKNQFPDAIHPNNPIIKMGFWPGGDRDGNPFVNTDTTLKVADALRGAIIKCYYLEIRKLRRRLTFKLVDVRLAELEKQLYNNIFIPGNRTRLTKQEILDVLNGVREILIYQHNGLFLYLVDNLINKIHVFGLHFASIDIRQDSSIHKKVFEALVSHNILPADYLELNDDKKIEFITKNEKALTEINFGDDIINDTFESIKAIKSIQEYNGEPGCNRYIISHSSTALNVLEVYGLFILSGWKKDEMNVDIVPLIETIDDLKNAASIVKILYENEEYRAHLKRRNNSQTIMLGFSDGTKDGGYLMGNWSIYKTKEELTSISKEYNISVVFFDGRGGPPARGGGKTHKFYASMGKNIANKEIQLTIQGQTVSSNFGTIDSAQFNMEQLIHAGISNDIFSTRHITLEKEEEDLLQELADASFDAYSALKNHPDFMDYLIHISPLKFYGETNIGSRPSKRGASKLTLDNLRAIPFVGAWSQLKQNVTGFYGVGAALQKMEKESKLNKLKSLYQHSLFFKTLIDNCEMAMKKCFFPLTEYLSKDERYAEIWNMIYVEYNITEKYLFQLTGKNELMADYAVEQQSIGMREKIVLPLVTIQQFAIENIRKMEKETAINSLKNTYEKLAMRCSFGIINAGRNSA
jgi:phosphoenolpyruvate carboxylase